MIDSLKKHKFIYIFMLVASIIVGGTFLMTNAKDEAGKISLEKNATKVYEGVSEDNLEKGRFAQVTLDVNAKSYDVDAKTKLDIVLVIDNSSSMGEKDANPSKTLSRRQAAKDAATDFVGKLINEGKDNVKIGVVVFGTDIQSTQQLSSNKTTINDFISGISSIYNQGTNVQAGIAKANELLATGRTDAKKAVIILTDGEPTYFNYTYTYYSHGTKVTKIKSAGNGNNNETVGVCYEENRSGICTDYRWVKPSEAAKAELDSLKSIFSAADVYTIAFGSQSGNSLSEINPASSEGATPIYVNYSALTGDELKAKFDGISDSLVELIGKDSVVTDVIPKEFKLTESAKTKLTEQGIDVVENEDGTTTLTWNIGNVNANTDYKITYEVKAEDDYYGSIYTNKNASLTTTVDEDNPYYKNEENKTITVEFDKPNVAVPMVTKDDHYSEISSYEGYAESTINGTSILDNDLNENLMTDSNVNVSDKIVVIENSNTKKASENTYEISKDGVKQGVLTMNNDGTFTFVSEENISGEVEFLYHVETTLNPSVETNKVVSRDSKVTLNILSRSKVNVSGKKIWDDSNNQDGIRPTSINIVLNANGVTVARKTLTSTDWTYSFNDLYKYQIGHENDDNYLINYEIKEVTEVQNYVTTYNGYDIINTHIPEVTFVSGTKTWDDNNNQDGIRPDSITVKVFNGINLVTSKTVTKDDNWEYTFDNLPKYENGNEIKYQIKEDEVSGYETVVTGNNIKNTHTPELINDNTGKLSVEKTWDDNNNQDGLRKDVEITLYADGVVKETVTLNDSNEWKHTFENLAKYNNGNEIAYTVDEKEITGYTKLITGSVSEGFKVTNTHTPELINDNTGKLNVEKSWDDNNNQDGIRNAVEITLYADGEVKETVTLNAQNEWKHTFEKLAKYNNGNEIVYTIDEKEVTGYTKEITGSVSEGFKVTNSHKPELVNNTGKINVEKTWDDNNNQDGLRNAVEITLYADGVVKETVTLNDSNEWKHTFEKLAKYNNGKEIVYTVDEKEVTGYTKEITGSVSEGFKVTNSHTPELINNNTGKLSVEKSWDDNNNQDGLRKDVEITLYADGVVKETVTLNAENEWKHTFENLAKYNNGNEIAYTVDEKEITGYTKEITGSVSEGFKVTNTHTPEETTVTGRKVWQDANNQDGIRPTSITVKLYADGNYVTEGVITAGENNNWAFAFTNLPKYNNGNEIKYTVEEVSVDGYTTTYGDNNTIINTHEVSKISVSGTKTWDDNDDQDGKRPESIKVRLYANGTEVRSKDVTVSDNWTYSFEDLDEYSNSSKISYTITEDAVEGYTTVVDGYNITNSHTPEKINISGTKTWDDNDDQDGKRPENITVRLYANGTEFASKDVTAEDEWPYSFEDLDKYANDN